jgi:hypothetical protein
MRRTVRVLTIAGCLALVAAAPQAHGQRPAEAKAQKQKTTISKVQVFGAQTIVPGAGSVLLRTRDGVYMSMHSFGLPVGDAVSAWWVFFNNPEKCATTPCTPADLSNPEVGPSLVIATGRVVGADGSADFGAYRAVGDATGAHSGTGLLNPFKAEIHFVVRSHGPAMVDDPAALAEQLSTFNGGCPPNTCGNLQASVHQP